MEQFVQRQQGLDQLLPVLKDFTALPQLEFLLCMTICAQKDFIVQKEPEKVVSTTKSVPKDISDLLQLLHTMNS